MNTNGTKDVHPEADTARIALVTGANRGIGRAIALRLARGGFHVVVTARQLGAAEAVVRDIVAAGGKAEALALDTASVDSVDAAARDFAARHARLDALVNNAGIAVGATKHIFASERAELDQALATNAFGPWQVTRAFLPALRRSPAARVVNVSSTAGSIADTADLQSAIASFEAAPYRLSKSALNMITVLSARALRGDGILVNAMCPGWVRTDMGGPEAPRTPEQAAEVAWRLATLSAGGPSGGFFDEAGAVPW